MLRKKVTNEAEIWEFEICLFLVPVSLTWILCLSSLWGRFPNVTNIFSDWV